MSTLQNDADSGLDYVAVGATENPKHILVMLHGSGADYSDMEAAAKFFTKKMPDTVILVPNAPFKFVDILPKDQADQIKASGMDTDKMRSWFDAAKTEGLNEREAYSAVMKKTRETGDSLNKFISSQMRAYNLGESQTAVYGFSQGGVLALQSGIDRYPSPLAAVVSHSGYMLGGYAMVKPRTLMIVGSQELVDGHPMKDMHAGTMDFLKEDGIPLTEHVAPGLAHGLNMNTVNAATSFINKAFAGPTAEATKDLSATFAAFAKPEVEVRETLDGDKVLYADVLDTNSTLMKDFRKAATDAGFRDIRIVTPGMRYTQDTTPDRLTAVMAKGQDGKYHLGGFRPG